MSAACGCEAPESPPADQVGEEQPWWRDLGIVVPVLSGVAFAAGLVLAWIGQNAIAEGAFWVGLVLGGYTFVPGAVRSLVRRRTVGIAMLMTISAVGAVVLGYVQEAAALAFLYSIAEALEDKAMDRARGGLRALLKLTPTTATILQNGTPSEISAADLVAGQTLLVRPGERVATDGVVRNGRSGLDTSAITGESIPVDVGPGDRVLAGSINTSVSLEITATADGTDNSLTTIVHLVEQAQAHKGDRARLADTIARPLVPGVIVLAILVGSLGAVLGDPETWITRALVVLVAASPCALAIAVPVTVVSAIGAASQFGVIIKSGAAFEQLGTIRHVALDKTGTLTRNEPTVAAVIANEPHPEAAVLALAAALEQHSTHPIATAILAAADRVPHADDVREQAGQGVTGTVDGHAVAVGSPRAISPGPFASDVEALEREGQTCVLVTLDGFQVGVIGIRDGLRDEVPAVVRTLEEQGINVSMLSGDNARTAETLAALAGIGDVHAELSPEDKARLVSEFARTKPTAMIGDGINDSPALAGATVGIAMGTTGADAAIESADVAFTGHDLRLIPQALLHAKRGRDIINQNIVLSLLIIATLLPLAITGVLGLATVVLVHEAAEVVVIANGLRAARTPRGARSRLDAIPARATRDENLAVPTP